MYRTSWNSCFGHMPAHCTSNKRRLFRIYCSIGGCMKDDTGVGQTSRAVTSAGAKPEATESITKPSSPLPASAGPGELSKPASDDSAAALQEGEDRYQEIQKLAYELWETRGNPVGSPDVDWNEAEQQLKSRRKASA